MHILITDDGNLQQQMLNYSKFGFK